MIQKSGFFEKNDDEKRAPFFLKKKYKKVVLSAAPRRNVCKKSKKPLFCIFRYTLRPALLEGRGLFFFIQKSIFFTEAFSKYGVP
jgi:hypothetical protein